MKKSILVTGFPSSGKSSLSKKLTEMGYTAYDMEAVPDLFFWRSKKTGEPVTNHGDGNLKKVLDIDWGCNIDVLKFLIENESSPVAFYFGNAADMDSLMSLFDSVILLKVSPETMRHRLTTRTENAFGRTAEIQDWLITWKDAWEDSVEKKSAFVIDTHKSLDDVAKEVIAAVGADALASGAMDRGT